MTDLTPEAVRAARERVIQFLMLELPGQPRMMHVGTSSLVNELDRIAAAYLALAKENERLRKRAEAADKFPGLIECLIESDADFTTEWDEDARAALAAYRATEEKSDE